MPDWLVHSVRFTVFVAPGTTVSPTLWREILSEDPEQSILQRSTATRIETGPYENGTLRLQVQPMKVDWIHEADEQPNAPLSGLGTFPDAVTPLLTLGRRWLTGAQGPPIQRVALGVILMSSTPDRETGYRELSLLIDGVPTSGDATDFLYQVNRPRLSAAGIDDLLINRISRWSVGGYLVVMLAPGMPQANSGTIQFHLRLELDISTAAEFVSVLPQDRLNAVIDDLLDGAVEVTERGGRT